MVFKFNQYLVPINPQGSNLETARPSVFEPRGRPTFAREEPEGVQAENNQGLEKPDDEKEEQIPDKPDPENADKNSETSQVSSGFKTY